MASTIPVRRFAPLASAVLAVFDLFVPASAVDLSSAIEQLGRPKLAGFLGTGFQDLADAVAPARARADDEAGAVEAFVTNRLAARREPLLRALLDYRPALSALDAGPMDGFSEPARQYLEVLQTEVFRIVRGIASTPELLAELPRSAQETMLRVLLDLPLQMSEPRVDRETLTPLFDALDLQSAPWHVETARPRLVAHFMTRPELVRLREILNQDQGTTRCTIAGKPGVGKSQLASWFAEECIDAGWGFVGWVVATDRVTAVNDLARIARFHPSIPARRSATPGSEASQDEAATNHDFQPFVPPEASQDEAAAALVDWLSKAGPGPRLLVFDDVTSADHLEGLIPHGPGMRVLITTSHPNAREPRIELGPFEPEQAVDFLTAVAGNPDRQGAALICEALGHLPLALAQAATSIRHRGRGYGHYRDALNRALAKAPTSERPEQRAAEAASWLALKTATRRLAQESPALETAGTAVLDALSLLAEQGVPRDWLCPVIDERDPSRAALGRLLELGVVTESHNGRTISLHQHQARAWRERRRGDEDAALDSAARVLTEVEFYNDCVDWFGLRHIMQAMVPQLLALLRQPHSAPLIARSDLRATIKLVFEGCLLGTLKSFHEQLAPYAPNPPESGPPPPQEKSQPLPHRWRLARPTRPPGCPARRWRVN